jgi:septal ring factor EnvC (AmiA/AmiB activator)
MSHSKQTPSSQDASYPETKEKPTQSNNDNSDNFGLVPLLRRIRQKETRSSIIESEIKALTALGSKLIDEITVKENRVKGKKESYKIRKLHVEKAHAALKVSTGKNPPLKVLVRELETLHPARPKTNIDKGFKAWTEGGVKDWWTDLNKGLSI